MKKLLLAILIAAALQVPAQVPVLPAGVYAAREPTGATNNNIQSQLLATGSTQDVQQLSIRLVTMKASTTGSTQQFADREQLVVVREGYLAVKVSDSIQQVGPRSIALLPAGTRYQFTNTTAQAVSFFIIDYMPVLPINPTRGKTGGGWLVKDWKQLEVKPTDKGETRPVFDRPTSAFERFEVHATMLKPGISSHAPHTHRAEEIILMLHGKGSMQLGNQHHSATAGDVMMVTADLPHAFTNNSQETCGYYAIQWHHQ